MRVIVFLFISFFCFFYCNGQRYALIDQKLERPILYTDSVTIGQISNSYFPVRVEDLDSVVANIGFLQEELKGLQRAKFKSYKMRSGHTDVIVTTISKAYGDSYDISLFTPAGILKAEYLVADNRSLNKKAINRLKAFVDYIKNDKALVIHDYVHYNPVYFDVIVFLPSK